MEAVEYAKNLPRRTVAHQNASRARFDSVNRDMPPLDWARYLFSGVQIV